MPKAQTVPKQSRAARIAGRVRASGSPYMTRAADIVRRGATRLGTRRRKAGRPPSMHTVDSLIREAHRYRSNFNIAERIDYVKLSPEPENRILSCSTDARSSEKPSRYDAKIVFFNVEFNESEDQGHPITVNTLNGKKQAIARIDSGSNPIQVRCECQDFRHTFAVWNNREQALSGPNFPPYERVPGSTRPERNPNHIPGMCKHLMALVEKLKRDRVLV